MLKLRNEIDAPILNRYGRFLGGFILLATAFSPKLDERCDATTYNVQNVVHSIQIQARNQPFGHSTLLSLDWVLFLLW